MDQEARAKLAAELSQLRADYLVHLTERIGAIGDAMDQVAHGAGGIVAGLEAIRFEAHKVAGSGAMFGFDGLSITAREVELRAAALIDADGKPSAADRAVLAGLVDRLKIVAGQVRAEPEAETETASSPIDHVQPPKARNILLIEPDRAVAEEIVVGLAGFGFSVRRVARLSGRSDFNSEDYAAILVAPGDDETENLTKVFSRLKSRSCPRIVLSARRDLPTRLAAVRAEVDAFLFKPVTVGKLVDVLDRLMATEDMEPYRVMVIDDDPSVAGFVDVVLRGAGMITTTITDPMTALERMDDFSPELILLDLNMPGCNGEELASVIRQQENLAGISIVFLSGEADPVRRLEALRRGADDFLAKPIHADDLIAAVRTRVQRFRLLRNLMIRDSMTGLVNHSTFWESMEIEVARARRSGESLSLAVLDIDHFKRVNDTHGHGVGDVVIKGFARLLQQTVRQSDHIGRLGGEEFGVALTGADAATAAVICDRIRESFAKIQYASEEGPFSVTMSGGIASFPAIESAGALYKAADAALYAAKTGGRNRIVVSETKQE